MQVGRLTRVLQRPGPSGEIRQEPGDNNWARVNANFKLVLHCSLGS